MTRRLERWPRRNRTADLMLGIVRYPEDRRADKFVNDLLGGSHYKFIGPARGLDRAVRLARQIDLWTPEVEERTQRFVDSFGILYAENYLQAALKLRRLKQPDEAQDTLYDVSLNAYRRLKKRAGQFFLLSYPKMIELGQNPEQYLARVETAKDSGGSLFAAKFARYLPHVIEAGGNQDEYGSAALAIRHGASFKMSSLFMSLAPEMATEGEGRIYEYKDHVSESIDVLGAETTSWALPAYVYLEHRAGISSQQTQAELAEIMVSYGEKAAQWYAAGLRRIGEAFPDPDKKPGKFTLPRHNRGDATPTIETVDAFKKAYPEVLTQLGITAASFYARTVEFTDPVAYKGSMVYSQSVIGKTLFDKALWAIIKSNNGVWNEEDAFHAWINFNRLVARFRKYPREQFLALMDYAVKTASLKKKNFGVKVPRKSMSSVNRKRYGIDTFVDPYSDSAHTHEGETALYNKSCIY